MPKSNPPSLPSNQSVIVAVGLSVVAGAFMGSVVVEQMFVEGLTDKERRNLLAISGVVLAGMAAKKFLDIDERLVSIEKLAQNPPNISTLLGK